MPLIDEPLQDIREITAIVQRINEAKLLSCIALDQEGPYGTLVDALDEIGVNEESEQIVGIGQGYKLMNAIKTVGVKVKNGTFRHSRSRMMDWSCSNVKIEPTATGLRATKQNAGDAKIDPWCALMDAATVMARNPTVKRIPEYTVMFV